MSTCWDGRDVCEVGPDLPKAPLAPGMVHLTSPHPTPPHFPKGLNSLVALPAPKDQRT